MLSERRKADRERMAADVAALARELGARVEISNPAPLSPRGIWVEIEAPGGLSVTVDFDGQSCQPDVHVVSWHMRPVRNKARLASCFPGGDVNPFHRQKASYIARGFDELAAHLREVLSMALAGTIYMPAAT